MSPVLRAPWNDFPDVVIAADERAIKNHPVYGSAKTGDVASAKSLATSFVDQALIDSLYKYAPSHALQFVPVHAIEARGINRIPAAFAELLASRMGQGIASGIVQANVVTHTGATGWERIARPALFDGPVARGGQYLIVDDFVGQGGTLANLRGYLIAGGASVLAAITLTGKAYSAKLTLTDETLNQLRQKHGSELETWWQETFGYRFDCLTESEARYLVRAEDAHTIRARIIAARS